MNDNLLLYMHIPKTGGSSFTQAIIEHCPNILHYHMIGQSGQLKEKLVHTDALCGHFLFGAHHLTDRPYQYVTLLRHPVERVLSFFYFKYKNPKYTICYDEELTIDEYINNPRNVSEYSNIQARMISGYLETSNPKFNLVQKNLAEHFAFVGITERYDISQFLFMQMMNWAPKQYPIINITHNRPAKTLLSSHTLKQIITKNEIDIKLYEMAYREFSQKVTNLPLYQARQLKAYLRAARKNKAPQM